MKKCVCDDMHFGWGERVKARIGRVVHQWMLVQVCIAGMVETKGIEKRFMRLLKLAQYGPWVLSSTRVTYFQQSNLIC